MIIENNFLDKINNYESLMLKTLYALKKGNYPADKELGRYNNETRIPMTALRNHLAFGEKHYIRSERALELLGAIEKDRSVISYIFLTPQGEKLVEEAIKQGHKFFIQ